MGFNQTLSPFKGDKAGVLLVRKSKSVKMSQLARMKSTHGWHSS